MPTETSPNAMSPADWENLGAHPGLCRECAHVRLLASARSTFLRCALSDRDPRYLRYPVLPVRACSGYEPMESRLA